MARGHSSLASWSGRTPGGSPRIDRMNADELKVHEPSWRSRLGTAARLRKVIQSAASWRPDISRWAPLKSSRTNRQSRNADVRLRRPAVLVTNDDAPHAGGDLGCRRQLNRGVAGRGTSVRIILTRPKRPVSRERGQRMVATRAGWPLYGARRCDLAFAAANGRVELAIPAYLHSNDIEGAVASLGRRKSRLGFIASRTSDLRRYQMAVSLMLTPTSRSNVGRRWCAISEDPDDPTHRQMIAASVSSTSPLRTRSGSLRR